MIRPLSVSYVLALTIVSFAAATASSGELTPDRIRRAKNATCLVEIPAKTGQAAFGTAFCIDRSGILVTNAHVTKKASAGTLKLVFNPGGADQRVLEAKVLRTADTTDLALIKVEKTEGLESLELGKVDQLIETAPLAAFGYPYGNALSVDKGQYPSISVNLGRITSLRQKQGELEVIQLDAMLNPGNSGGPVLDGEGRVVGVVASGLVGSGINFAIPVTHLEKLLAKPDIVIAAPGVPAERQHESYEFAIQVIGLTQPKPEYVVELTLSTGPQDIRTMTAKVEGETAKFAVIPVPARQGPKRLRLTVNYAGGSVVGQAADRDVKVGEQTLKLSEIRQLCSGDKKNVTLVSGKETADSLTGAGKVDVDLGGMTVTLDLGKAAAMAVEDLEKPVAAVAYKVVVKACDKVVGEAAGNIAVTGAAVAGSPVASVVITPPGVATLEGDCVTRSMPGMIDEVTAGGAGRYLLFHLRKLRKLAIFDVAQAKITQYLPLNSDDVLYAAGCDKLVLVSRDQNVIQRYDLVTLQKELTVPLPEVGQVDGLILGHASPGPAMLMTRTGPRFLNLATLTLVDSKNNLQNSNWQPHPQYSLQVRASADGSTFAAWQPGLSPSGIRILALEGDSVRCRSEHSSAGILLPSYDGNLLLTSVGIYSADLKPVSPEQFRNVACFPSYHPAYFLGFSGNNRYYSSNRDEKAKLSLYTTGDKRLLVSFEDFAELKDPKESPGSGATPLAIDKRIHFFPTANLLVNIPASREQLVLRRLEVTAALEKAGIDYLFVTSLPPATASRAGTLTYAITVQSRRGGLRYTLDSGPEGMTLSDDGKLRWSVPVGLPAGRHGVIVTIKDAAGQEVLHSFNIAIR